MKYTFILIGWITLLFGLFWTFNHVNPWIAIVGTILFLVFTIHLFFKQIINKL